MKITKDHYARLSNLMTAEIVAKFVAEREALRSKAGLVDMEQRLRWDAFHKATQCKAGYELTREIFQYANDSHIETALKSIMKTPRAVT